MSCTRGYRIASFLSCVSTTYDSLGILRSIINNIFKRRIPLLFLIPTRHDKNLVLRYSLYSQLETPISPKLRHFRNHRSQLLERHADSHCVRGIQRSDGAKRDATFAGRTILFGESYDARYMRIPRPLAAGDARLRASFRTSATRDAQENDYRGGRSWS